VASAPLWPLVLYFIAVIVLLSAITGVSSILGERHSERATGEPYESGMVPTGSARRRFDVNFYLMAVFFVIFDLETAFIIAWAAAWRQAGWSGYVEIVVFIAILMAALVYLWRVGALNVLGKGPGSEPRRLPGRLR
jgi:NADH-quinone oxidoreductase subunit A